MYIGACCTSLRITATLAYVSIRQHTSHTSAYVSIRQHTPAYASIRQHTSAYVSTRHIRQHTSAFVSIRQNTTHTHQHAYLRSIEPDCSAGEASPPLQQQLQAPSAVKLADTSAYVSIRQHTPAYASIRQHTSAYVSIRQHTSAYVSIRQHTSAYASIRQHTSAYSSIRQHAWFSLHARGVAACEYMSLCFVQKNIRGVPAMLCDIKLPVQPL